MKEFKLKCLICGEEAAGLVLAQEHVMDEHGYTQADLRQATREVIAPEHYVWSMPDGVKWLDAERV